MSLSFFVFSIVFESLKDELVHQIVVQFIFVLFVS